MCAALFLVSIIAAVSTSGLELTRLDEDKASWHVQATRRLERTLEAKGGRDTEQARMLHESLSVHNQARELLRETDLPESVKLKFSAGLDMHEKAVDKAIHDLGVSGHSEVIKIMKRSEESVMRHYYRALSYGAVPPPRPKVEVLRAALLEATGIDALKDADGKLFDIMVEHPLALQSSPTLYYYYCYYYSLSLSLSHTHTHTLSLSHLYTNIYRWSTLVANLPLQPLVYQPSSLPTVANRLLAITSVCAFLARL